MIQPTIVWLSDVAWEITHARQTTSEKLYNLLGSQLCQYYARSTVYRPIPIDITNLYHANLQPSNYSLSHKRLECIPSNSSDYRTDTMYTLHDS